jgi:hypothetical protein
LEFRFSDSAIWHSQLGDQFGCSYLGEGRRTAVVTPKKSAPLPPQASPVKRERQRAAIVMARMKDEPPSFDEDAEMAVAAPAFGARTIADERAALAHCFEAAGSASIMMNSASLADAAAPSLLNSLPHQPENLAVRPPVQEDIEMPSSGIAASALSGPASAAEDCPEAAAGATKGTMADEVYCSGASGSASIGRNSAPPAAALTLVERLNRAVNPAMSSSSSSGDFGGTGVPAVPAVAALFASRMANGCRTNKTGVCGVELSKSGQSRCQHCQVLIAKSVPRFLYWHSLVKPPGYIHTGCIVGLTLPAAELRDNLSGLSPTEPILKEAIVDAMAALAARAF